MTAHKRQRSPTLTADRLCPTRRSLVTTFSQLCSVLSERLGCGAAVLGAVSLHSKALAVLALWPSTARARIHCPVSARPDAGLQAMAEGRLDAIVYSDTAAADGHLARLFASLGCQSAVVAPILTEPGRATYFVAIGLNVTRERIIDTLAELLSVITPLEPVAA